MQILIWDCYKDKELIVLKQCDKTQWGYAQNNFAILLKDLLHMNLSGNKIKIYAERLF